MCRCFQVETLEIFQWSSLNVGFWTEIFQFFWDRSFDEQLIALRNWLPGVCVVEFKIFFTGSILMYFACHWTYVLWVYWHQVDLSYLMIWVKMSMPFIDAFVYFSFFIRSVLSDEMKCSFYKNNGRQPVSEFSDVCIFSVLMFSCRCCFELWTEVLLSSYPVLWVYSRVHLTKQVWWCAFGRNQTF